MIVECHEPCDACYNCLHRGECHWDSARRCMVREDNELLPLCSMLSLIPILSLYSCIARKVTEIYDMAWIERVCIGGPL